MLTLTFLGVGNAFAKRNFHSNALVEAWSRGPDHEQEPQDTLLIDFGTTGPLALHQLKDRPGFAYLDADGVADYTRIRHVFITHQHADHIGGLEELAFMNTCVLTRTGASPPFRPRLIVVGDMHQALWDGSLKGGLRVLQGRYAALEDYFCPVALDLRGPEPDAFTLADRYRFVPVPTDHLHVEERFDWPSFGLQMIDAPTGRSVFYTGDSRFDFAAYRRLMADADLCFHEVQLVDQPDPVHALLSELRALPAEIKKKTVLYHYGDDWDSGEFDFVNEEFAGFAKPQQRYVLFD
ncbi:MAG: MBL fold metallo-hydrolase [Phycisphaerales bacterium]|nr:MAG: MBL fold metallo-hydrolase [Phycisphaerales bacterium]